ncbi:pectinesterase family protein [Flavobacterium marginilacus]|uniref:pectinesterase family protein n=1 Tax=Flavobacterium marginilacus TaxID=3003256 RepID=UPI00248DA0BD|nr:pectinesterase family protein [Flavobacterium marginilacus]
MKKITILKYIFLCLMVSHSLLSQSTKSKKYKYNFIVAQDGSGDYKTVQEAFNAVSKLNPERTVIFVKKGTYKEVITLEADKNNVVLIGEEADKVILIYDNYSSKINPVTGKGYGTSNSSSCFIIGTGFYAKNITFENSSGPVGQALAINIQGDKAVFVNCKFLGFQDTLYGADCRQYFKDCYIEGSTDFIFGSSTAFFDHCTLHTKGGSAITAASTKQHVNFGYVFNNCKITGTGAHITTLGRPWRPYAAVAFINTEMSDAVKPSGWNNWGKTENESTARYSEYKSSGWDAYTDERVKWMRILTPDQVKLYSMENVLKTINANPPVADNWNPNVVIETYK